MNITFEKFRSAFDNENYTYSELVHLFKALKSMDNESRKSFVNWFFTGELPDKQVEGISAEYLINNLNCKPLNAFIILDWLKSEPETAKYFVMKLPVLLNSQENFVLNNNNNSGEEDEENSFGEITD